MFGLTRGLRDRFGERVRDTPISETAVVGVGVGGAMAGLRPVTRDPAGASLPGRTWAGALAVPFGLRPGASA